VVLRRLWLPSSTLLQCSLMPDFEWYNAPICSDVIGVLVRRYIHLERPLLRLLVIYSTPTPENQHGQPRVIPGRSRSPIIDLASTLDSTRGFGLLNGLFSKDR